MDYSITNKDQRIGRNPKNKKSYLIKARKSLSFKISHNFNKKINNF